MVKDITVKVEQNTYAFGVLLVKFVGEIAKLAKDGISIGDLPAAMSAVMSELIPALQLVQTLPADQKEDLEAFLMALEVNLHDLVKVILNPPK